jgi:hypothetical protein
LIYAATKQYTQFLDMVSSVFMNMFVISLFIDMIVILNLNGKDAFKTDWLGLDCLSLAWLGMDRLGLAWLGLAWLGSDLHGLARLGMAWKGFTCLGMDKHGLWATYTLD